MDIGRLLSRVFLGWDIYSFIAWLVGPISIMGLLLTFVQEVRNAPIAAQAPLGLAVLALSYLAIRIARWGNVPQAETPKPVAPTGPLKSAVLAAHDGITIDDGIGAAKATLYLDVANFSQREVLIEAAVLRLDTVEGFSLYMPSTIGPLSHRRFEIWREINQEQKAALLAKSGEIHTDGVVTITAGAERITESIVADRLFVRRGVIRGELLTPVTSSWVEEQLRNLGFDHGETRTRLPECMDRLKRHGLLSTHRATPFFTDTVALNRLRNIYKGFDLERTTGPLDPLGFCAWGPILHRASPDEAGLAEAYVREAIRAWKESGGDRPPDHAHDPSVVSIFPNRESLNGAHPLAESLRSSDRVYGLFISGQGVLREIDQALLKSKLARVLMPSPDTDALKRIQQALNEIGAMFDLGQEVFTSTLTAGRLGIETRWSADFLGVTALIGDPNRESGWAHIEVCLPYMHPNYRPAFRLERQRHREAFDRLWKSYEAIWNASEPPDLDPPRVRSDSMVDQVRRQQPDWRAQSFSVAGGSGEIRSYTAGELLDLSQEVRFQILCTFPDLARWWWSLR